MANSIVFQNNPSQLKASLYGYNTTNNSYELLAVNSTGQLNVTGTFSIDTVTKINVVGTINRTKTIGTLGTVNAVKSIMGTVNINVAGRNFYSTVINLVLGSSDATLTETSTLLNVSQYQDVSYYIRNISATNVIGTVQLQMQATPSMNLTNYPLVSINEKATLLESTPVAITTDYFMKYNAIQASRAAWTHNQTIQIVFNARY